MRKPIVVTMLLVVMLGVLCLPSLAQEPATCESDYTIKVGDSLQEIAEKYYGDRYAYTSIVDATNAKAASDDSYAAIENPSIVQPGWKLCLPSVDGVVPGEAVEQESSAALSVQVLKNMEYRSDWTDSGAVMLTDGDYREPGAAGSAGETEVMLADTVAFGELNGQKAAAVVLVTNTGGTGDFTDLALVVDQGGKATNIATAPLGDRVKVNSLAIADNEIAVDMVTHGPDDPACCPTQHVVQHYSLEDNELKQTQRQVEGTVKTDHTDQTTPEATGPEAGLASGDVVIVAEGLARDTEGVPVEAIPYDNSQPPGPVGSPAHVAYLLDDKGGLRVYPVKEYENLWNAAGDSTVSNNVTQLQTILAKRPQVPQNPLPYLPPIYAYNDLAAQVEFLDFDGGSGVRYVGRFTQDASPVLNDQLEYIFQGLTSDGRYYVSFEQPVTSSALPDNLEGMTVEQQAEAEGDYQEYLQETHEALDALTPEDFSPALSELDGAIGQLKISEQPTTESQATRVTATTWKLREVQEMSGDTAHMDDPDKYTLELLPDGGASVRSDCNFGKGTYTLNGDKLSIDINILTKALCPPDSLSDQYINMLNEANSFVLEGGDLYVSYGIDAGVMKFTR